MLKNIFPVEKLSEGLFYNKDLQIKGEGIPSAKLHTTMQMPTPEHIPLCTFKTKVLNKSPTPHCKFEITSFQHLKSIFDMLLQYCGCL